MALPFPASGAIVCPVKLTLIPLLAGLALVPCTLGADAKADYEKLAKEIQVRELNTLMPIPGMSFVTTPVSS